MAVKQKWNKHYFPPLKTYYIQVSMETVNTCAEKSSQGWKCSPCFLPFPLFSLWSTQKRFMYNSFSSFTLHVHPGLGIFPSYDLLLAIQMILKCNEWNLNTFRCLVLIITIIGSYFKPEEHEKIQPETLSTQDRPPQLLIESSKISSHRILEMVPFKVQKVYKCQACTKEIPKKPWKNLIFEMKK